MEAKEQSTLGGSKPVEWDAIWRYDGTLVSGITYFSTILVI